MVRYLIFLLFFTFIWADQVDELVPFCNNNSDYLVKPEQIYKDGCIWYSLSTNQPFTGRIEVYSKNSNQSLVAECTIYNGLKNGNFIQYYDAVEWLPGIIGLYVNNLKQGLWVFIEPIKEYKNDNSLDAFQIITNIDYRDGLKHGTIVVQKASMNRFQIYDEGYYSIPTNDFIVKGRYINNKKVGEWYFYDPIFSDENLTIMPKEIVSLSSYWTRIRYYDDDKVIDRRCREPWNQDIDCDEYLFKYWNTINSFPFLEKFNIKMKEAKKNKTTFIKDINGSDVEINVKEFVQHIGKCHLSKVNIHKQDGHSFKVNDTLRKKLNKIIKGNK